MARYSKAIGATVGAVALWFAAFGVQSIDGVDLGHLFELLATFLGSGIGAYVAPRNA